jgi:hypothetical protein
VPRALRHSDCNRRLVATYLGQRDVGYWYALYREGRLEKRGYECSGCGRVISLRESRSVLDFRLSATERKRLQRRTASLEREALRYDEGLSGFGADAEFAWDM